MAAFAKKSSFHQTLTGAQVDTITLAAAADWVEVLNRDATAANTIWVRVYSVQTPAPAQIAAAVAGDDSFVLQGGFGPASSRRFKVPGAGGAVISVVGANASPMSVQIVDGPSI